MEIPYNEKHPMFCLALSCFLGAFFAGGFLVPQKRKWCNKSQFLNITGTGQNPPCFGNFQQQGCCHNRMMLIDALWKPTSQAISMLNDHQFNPPFLTMVGSYHKSTRPNKSWTGPIDMSSGQNLVHGEGTSLTRVGHRCCSGTLYKPSWGYHFGHRFRVGSCRF